MKEQDNTHHKEFGLSSLAIGNKITVFVITFIILFGGVMSYLSMPRENFPEVIIPEIYVGTPYPGNSPLDIEKLITRPLEKEINAITGVDKITSTSIQGYSTIQVKFNFDVTPAEALRKVKDKVDIAMSDSDFPDDLPADPNIFEMNFSELIPVMNVNLSGDFSVDQLKDYGEILEDRIEDLPQISKVDIRGVMDKEVRIDVDLHKMESMNIAFGDIARAIQEENITISGGDLLVGDYRRTVRVTGEFESMEDILDVIVKREKFNIVYLRDIAQVVFTEEEKESYAREFESPVVMLDIIKRAGENLIESSDSIESIIKTARANDFPENLDISITNNQSDATKTQVSELVNSIIFGVLLVVLVLLFFLGLRNALFVGVAIPLSMFLSFMILSALGITLNVMVLFSLVLALGMLVDNGIVVVENIYRLMDEGMNPLDAAKRGVGEVAMPIIASTATTLAAFVPLAIWPGQMGEFMKYLPMTLMIVLSSSLFVALVINPVLTAVFMRVEENKVDRKKLWIISGILLFIFIVIYIAEGVHWFGSLMLATAMIILINTYILTPGARVFQERILPVLERFYENVLRFALKGYRPILFVVGTLLLLFMSMGLLQKFPPKVEFFPSNEPQYVNVFIDMPIGTDIEFTNEITKKIESNIIRTISKDEYLYEDENGEQKNFLVESVIGQVGKGTSDPMQGPSMGNTPHKARVTVSFVKFQDRRGINTSDVMEEIRQNVGAYPGVQIAVSKNENGPAQGAPINIELSGDDYFQLIQEADNIKRFLDNAGIEGYQELKMDVEQGKPEFPIVIDRQKARRFNLSTMQIGDALRTSLFGKEISTYKDGEDDYPIMLRYDNKYRYDIDALMNQRITFRDQMTGKIRQVPISSVAEAELSSTFSAVKRRDLNRLINISSNLIEGYNANEIVAEMKKAMEAYDLPEGNRMKFTGQQEEQAKEMEFLGGALIIALFLIFLIIVSQFNSAATPFIILISVFFSLIGVLLGLVIFQMDFVIIMTMIGIISLAGIVVNNAIVLIDYTNLIRSRKKAELGLSEDDVLSKEDLYESIVQGGKTRLRPVLLTAITTILGLVPLAIGLNIDFIGLLTEFDAHFYIGGDNVIFWGPMSWTIIFGLTFATFLTLVLVPVMYLLFSKLQHRRGTKKSAKKVVHA